MLTVESKELEGEFPQQHYQDLLNYEIELEKDEDKEEEKHEDRIELKATEDVIDQSRN